MEQGYTLPEKVVLDTLESLTSTSVKTLVVGGIGVSLHTYPKSKGMLRRTKDVDTSLATYLTRSEFKEFVINPIVEYLYRKAYLPEIKTPHHFYGIEVLHKNSKRGPFYLSIPRRSRKLFKKIEKRVLKELKNAEEIKIPKREEKVVVARAEDLIAPKLLRKKEKDLFDIYILSRVKKIDEDYLKESLIDYGIEGELLDDLYKQFLKIAQKV